MTIADVIVASGATGEEPDEAKFCEAVAYHERLFPSEEDLLRARMARMALRRKNVIDTTHRFRIKPSGVGRTLVARHVELGHGMRAAFGERRITEVRPFLSDRYTPRHRESQPPMGAGWNSRAVSYTRKREPAIAQM